MRKGCVVLVGKAGAGKSTVANHLVGHDPLSPDKPPFEVSNTVMRSVVREIQHETVEFMWENDLYPVTVVDTVGVFDYYIRGEEAIILDEFVQYIRQNKLRIDLILFVLKVHRLTSEEKDMFSFILAKNWENHIAGCPKDISPISALAITGCENFDATQREKLVQEFKTSPSTREVASQMGMGIYPVGFPPLRGMHSALKQAYKEGMLEDRDTLRGLIVRANVEGERGKQHCDDMHGRWLAFFT